MQTDQHTQYVQSSSSPITSGDHLVKDIVPEGLYILTGNNVISYFQSAANLVHATAIAANFTVTI